MPLSIVREDISRMMADAIVNPTNRDMIATGGTDLAIHRAAGRQLDAECISLSPLGVGQVKVTKGYRLPCRHVIHTVSPRYVGGHAGEEALLRACYLGALEQAAALGCETVAIPLIGSGDCGFPKDRVLRFAVSVITEFLLEKEMTVALCVYDRESYSFSQKLFSEIRAEIDDAYVAARKKEEDLWVDACFSMSDVADDTPPPSPRRRDPDVASMRRPRVQALCRLLPDDDEETAPRPIVSAASACPPVFGSRAALEEELRHLDKGFRETLFAHIDRLGITDVECYKRANVDKRTFSKLKSNKNYRPSKSTAVAFAVALGLSLEETEHLLSTAGLALSEASAFDVIVRFFLRRGCHNVFEINEALFEFDQPLLGAV